MSARLSIAAAVGFAASLAGAGLAHAAGKGVVIGQAYQILELDCPVSHVMRALHAKPPPPDGLNRYFILSIGEGLRYVQCRLVDANRTMSCEASSGYRSPGHLEQSEGQAAFIRRKQFFLPAEGGNFTRDFAISDESDLDAASTILVNVLRGGFTANVSESVTVTSPVLGANLRRIVRRRCVPVS